MVLYNTIMLIDDDEDDREIFSSAISRIDGIDVFCEFECPILAYEALDTRQVEPDIIFLDLNMPKMNGVELLKKIKEHPALAQIPVVIFSTSSNYKNIKETMDLGALDYITKPYKFQELLQVLNRLFAQ